MHIATARNAAKTPLAVFTYNRPQHTERLLRSLANCQRLDECAISVYSDAARVPEHEAQICEVRSLVRRWADELPISLVERPANWGLTKSIVSGITGANEQFGRVIVLEDDLVVSPDFLDFMLQALDRYVDDPRVFAVSGYMYPIQYQGSFDAFFLPLASGWGWATWKRAWDCYDVEAKGAAAALRIPETHKRFNLNSTFNFAKGLEQTITGRLHTWDYQWYWSVFKNNGLVLHPRASLTWNGGFDGSGIHCGSKELRQDGLDLFRVPRLTYPLRWPEVNVDSRAVDAIRAYQRSTTTLSWKAKFRAKASAGIEALLRG